MNDIYYEVLHALEDHYKTKARCNDDYEDQKDYVIEFPHSPTEMFMYLYLDEDGFSISLLAWDCDFQCETDLVTTSTNQIVNQVAEWVNQSEIETILEREGQAA